MPLDKGLFPSSNMETPQLVPALSARKGESYVKSSKEKTENNYSLLVPAVEQATKILKYLSSSPGFKTYLKDICTAVGIHNSKGYAILNTLQKAGYVNRDPHTKLYSLGYTLISLGSKSLESIHFRETVKPFLEDLARKTHCTALFALIAADQLVVVGREDSPVDVGVTLRLGATAPLTYSAPGKAIAAFLPKHEQSRLLSQDNLFFHGEPRDMDRKKLEKELLDGLLKGYTKAPAKRSPLVTILASPVLGQKGYPMGVIFIIGLFPKTAVESYGEKLADAARRLSTSFGSDVIWPSVKALEHARKVHGHIF